MSILNDNQIKAINWIDEQLSKPDDQFKITTGVILSLHEFLKVQKERIIEGARIEQIASYRRVKLLKDQMK